MIDSIINMWLVSKESEDKLLKDIEEMERRDKVGMMVRKEDKNLVQ